MTHVVYLHSALTKNRITPVDNTERRTLLRFARRDVYIALGLAGLINLSMLLIAANLFHTAGRTDVNSIEAAQVVMQGFIRRRIPLFLRRGLTVLPALAVLALGLNTTSSLVVSQVVLSFGIPFALTPLVMLSRRRDVMGEFVNRRITTITASIVVGIIVVLNVYLLYVTFAG